MFRTILCECSPCILMPDVFSLVISVKKNAAVHFITLHRKLSHTPLIHIRDKIYNF